MVDYKTFDVGSLKNRFHVVFDTVGALSWTQSRTLLRPGGICLDTDMNLGKMLRGVFGGRYKFVAAIPNTARLERVRALAAAGVLAPPIGKTSPLADAVSAISAFEAKQRVSGKLVIVNPA